MRSARRTDTELSAEVTRFLESVAIAVLVLGALVMIVGKANAATTQTNSCLDCHSGMDGNLKVTAEQFAQDIHAQKGLNCTSCHGGDANDMSPDAMSPKKGFRGHIDRGKVPETCAKCHADGSYMRQFNPSLRTDEYSQYLTSIHGKRLAKGDTKVAVCTDCHGVHDLRPASDSRSKVHPLNVADTCSRCHSDREHMKGYSISTDQFAGYSASVHHEALAVRGDLSAPTCTTCHGNHGAAPPGVASVENVCSTCHVFQAQLFDKSTHRAVFGKAGLPGCVTCHSNHRIIHPTDVMAGTTPQSICTNCHSKGDKGFATAAGIEQRIAALQTAIARADELLDRAEHGGMEVGEARIEQAAARDELTKARVTLHSFDLAKMDENINAGLTITKKTSDAGTQALKERDYRRMGLGVSFAAILVVVAGLWMKIRQIEGKG